MEKLMPKREKTLSIHWRPTLTLSAEFKALCEELEITQNAFIEIMVLKGMNQIKKYKQVGKSNSDIHREILSRKSLQ